MAAYGQGAYGQLAYGQIPGGPASTVQPPLIGDSSALYAPTLVYNQTVSPPLIADSSAVYAPTIGVIDHISPPAIADASTLHAPSVEMVISPAAIADGSALYAPTVAIVPAQSILVSSIDGAPVLFAPRLSIRAAAPIQIPMIGDTSSLGIPRVIQHSTTGTPRNYLIDRQTGEIYPWPVNHETEDPVKTLGRQLTTSGITASGKLRATRLVSLVKHPTHPGPVHLTLHGKLIDRLPPTQYRAFMRFFAECDDRTFDYIDASGASYHVSIVNFDARRQLAANREDGSYFDYALEVEVLGVNSGALAGFAV